MVKVKVISRSVEENVREIPSQLSKVHRSIDPLQHPFEKGREYVRALNATKWQKVFGKPFVASLDGHRDGVFTLAKHPTSLSLLLSGSCDGEVRLWNLAFKTTLYSVVAHSGFVRGLTVCPDGKRFISCGDDKTVKLWKIPNRVSNSENIVGKEERWPPLISSDRDDGNNEPLSVWLGKNAFTSIDHMRSSNFFATAAASEVHIWDEQRGSPVQTFSWGSDSVMHLRFNPIETEVLGLCATDRSIQLYDVRSETSIRKVVLEMKSNALCWNPMEAFNFTVANEDNNLYTFDMRKLQRALNVYKDHVSAVLDVDYSPTGREFCSGSYDRTVRIFRINEGKSREVYYTRRMQRIFSVCFSGDAHYVISGSDDTNIRLWKATADEPIKILLPRERQKLNYLRKLKDRYKHLPEIKRIDRHRQLPQAIYKAQKLKQIMKEAEKRRVVNKRRHSKPQKNASKKERKKHIVTEEE